MRNFISGSNSGRPIDFPSNAATHLPDGTEMKIGQRHMLNATQKAHVAGDMDVHARQTYYDECPRDGWAIFEGPSIAQQWKAEYQAMRIQRGWTARYYSTGIDPYCERHQEALEAEAMGQ